MAKVERKSNEQKGATLIEYAVLAALIVLVALAAIQLVGTRISTQFSAIGSAL